MSVFHKFFAFYDSSNPNKLSSKEATLFNLIWCDVKIYLCERKNGQEHIKKCKYIKKLIKMIFSLYEICSIY
jgi:hypothetical protein